MTTAANIVLHFCYVVHNFMHLRSQLTQSTVIQLFEMSTEHRDGQQATIQHNDKFTNTTIYAIPVSKLLTKDTTTYFHLSWQSPPPSSLQAQLLQLLWQLFVTKYPLFKYIRMSHKCALEHECYLNNNGLTQVVHEKTNVELQRTE